MRAALVIAAASAALLASGCGGSDSPPSDPAAEPAASPPLQQDPTGTTFHVGNEPEGLAFDPRTGLLAAATRDPDNLLLIDGRTGHVKRRVKLSSRARHLALALAGGPVLVPAERSDELISVALPSGRQRSVAVGDFPHAVARAPNGRLFVGDEGGDTISVVDHGRLVKTLRSPEQPGGVAVAGPYVAVVAVAAHVLQVYDVRTLARLETLPAGVGPTHLVSAGLHAWVVDTAGDRLETFAIGRKPELLGSLPLPGTPYGVAIDHRRKRIWVTLTARNELAEIDYSGAATRRVASYPTVRQPNTVAVDPASGDVYVAGVANGDIQRIPSPMGRG